MRVFTRTNFLHRRKRIFVSSKKKRAVCVPSPCTVTGERAFLVSPVRTIELFFQVDFHRPSAGARPVIGGRCNSNYRWPVSICRSDYFVPPKRGGCRELPGRLSPAIRNFLPILLSRAACAQPVVQQRHILSALHLGAPSVGRQSCEESFASTLLNLIVVTNIINAIYGDF